MVYTESYALPDYNQKEIRRYAGAGDAAAQAGSAAEKLLAACLEESHTAFTGKVCYMTVPVSVKEDRVNLSFVEVKSRSLAKNLSGCLQAVIFAATVGLEIDRLIRKYSKTDIARAVWLQAIGTERIEALCDTFCETIRIRQAEKGLYPGSRFSPGYGDLPLPLQKDILRALDCPRKIGLTLNESLLMTPSKSVTAIVGLNRETQSPRGQTCENCKQNTCTFRKECQ